jgi:hypothetical protein
MSGEKGRAIGEVQLSILNKSGGSLLRRYEEEARQRKIKEPGGQLHPTMYIKRK